MSAQAFVGTSGFAYAGWVPRFYPEGTKSKDFLRAYAARLRSVEINYTFNAFPTDRILAAWVEALPESCRISVKANRRITHETNFRSGATLIATFLERVAALGPRVSCILYQFPPWLRRDDGGLAEFVASIPGDGPRAAVEFRDASWYVEETYARLAERNVALVTAEGERAPAPYRPTADFVYVRLRRKERYPDDALAEWAARLRAELAAGRDVYAYLWHDEHGENALAAVRLAQALAS